MAYDRDDRPATSAPDGPATTASRTATDAQRTWRRDDRGFFDRAGDEISSWFGDDDAERRRREDRMRDERERGLAAAIASRQL